MSDDIKLIGIIGAGQMGLGIAQVFATSAFDVLINDNNKISCLLYTSPSPRD